MTASLPLTSRARVVALLTVLTLLVAACGGDDTPEAGSSTPTEAAEAAPTPTPTDTATAKPQPSIEPPEATAEPTATPEPTAEPTVEPTAPATTTPGGGEVVSGSQFEDLFSEGGSAGDMADVEIPQGEVPYSDYTYITDDTGAIALAVPVEWSDVDGRPYTDDQGRQLYDVRASSDLQAFHTTWTTPGVIVTASTEVAQSENEVTLLDELVEPLSSQCTYEGRQPYEDVIYTGQFDVFTNCAGTGVTYLVVGAVPSTRAFVIRVQVQVNDERDLEALDAVLQTFEVIGDV